MHKNPFKYLQIYDDIISDIHYGHLQPGDRLMTEEMLEHKYNVSRVTIRKALDKLIIDNYIERKKNAGNYIKKKIVEIANRNSFISFSKDNELRGNIVTTKTMDLTLGKPNNYVRSRIPDIDLDCDLWSLKRIRYINRLVVLYEESYWFYDLCGELTPKIVNGSICDHLESIGIYIAYAKNEYEAIGADESIAKILDVPLDFPILLTKATYLNSANQPIFVAKNYCRTDRTSIKVVLTRETA